MSDQLTHPASLPPAATVRRRWALPAAQAALILVLSGGLGVLGGVLWERLWTPGRGMVWDDKWNKGLLFLNPKTFAQRWSENAHQDIFAAVALYLLIALVAGVLVGLVASLVLARQELTTLVAVIVGGLLGGTLMGSVGMALGPSNPNAVAAHTANGVLLPDQLQLTGVSWHLNLFGWHVAPNLLYLAFPGASLLALAVVFLFLDRSRRTPA